MKTMTNLITAIDKYQAGQSSMTGKCRAVNFQPASFHRWTLNEYIDLYGLSLSIYVDRKYLGNLVLKRNWISEWKSKDHNFFYIELKYEIYKFEILFSLSRDGQVIISKN